MHKRRAAWPARTGPLTERRKPRRGTAAALALCLVAIGTLHLTPPPVAARERRLAAREVRTIHPSDFGVRSPAGIAYDPDKGALLVAGSAHRGRTVLEMTPGEVRLGTSKLPAGDPATIAFDDDRGAITTLNDDELSALGVADPAGATFDGSGSLLVLDAADRSIVRSRNGPSEKVERIPLQNTGNAGVRGLAFNPADGLLYVLSDSGKQLFAVDAQGRLRRTYTTRSLGLSDAVGMTFGRSADTTDASGHLNLFVAQAGTSTDLGGVMEVTLTQQAALDVPIVTANLVQTIDTSLFDPPSPDPAGIVYAEAQDRLMIVDSEVDEVTGAGYHGVNLWQTSRSGSVIEKGTTVGFTREPTGLGFDPASETLFVSADDDGGIHVVRQGNDGRFGTSDDLVGFINAAAHGVGDVEDPEFDPASGDLFFIDGVGAEVFRVDPVNNTFGDADDVVTHFDVGQYGVTDAEGLSSDPSAGTLLVGDRIQRKIFEVTKTGELLGLIDARAPGMSNLSGLAMAPASDGSGGMNYWIVDRAEDNGQFPTENDGKLFELSVQASGNQPPSVSAVTIDQTSPRTDEVLTVSVSAQDPDGDAFTYSYQWNRNGVALPGATNPTLDLSAPGAGERGDRISVRVAASDGQAQGSRTSSQVIVGNSVPTFDQELVDRSDIEEASVSLSARASDADGDTLVYDATGLPPGVAIDPASGSITGTLPPGAASNSPYSVSVTVREGIQDPGSPAPVTKIQKATADQAATSNLTSISASYGTQPLEGNLLVAFGHNSANRTPTIPPGWSIALETGTGAETVIFYKVAGPNEPTDVSYGVSGTPTFMGLTIFEYAGLHDVQTEVLDRAVFGSSLNSSSVSTGTSPETGFADELLLGTVSLNVTRNFQNTWTNGFVQQVNERRQTVAERIVSTVGEFETSESWDLAAGAAVGALVTFKGEAAGTPPPDPDPASATDTFTWTIHPPGPGNQTPTVNSVAIAPATPKTDDSVAAVVDATDPDGDALTYTYQWAKNGVELEGATGSSLDLARDGNGGKGDEISVEVTASDGSLSSLAVTSPGTIVQNSAPRFDLDLGDQRSRERDVVSLAATATDADGDLVTYAASGLPNGLSIDPSTGVIGGTIAAGAASQVPYNVSIAASDGSAGSIADTFAWTVDPSPPAQPTAFAATATSTDVRLGWAANLEPNLVGYNVYRGTSAGGSFAKLNATPMTARTFTDATAPRGTSFYRVTAVASSGLESSPAETSATRRILLRSVSTKSMKDAASLSINRPSVLSAGDLMVASLNVVGTPTITPPSGWTLVRTDTNGTAMRQAIYYKVAASNEPKSYSWSISPKRSAAGIILAYQGAATASPIVEASSGQANLVSREIFAPGIAPTSGEALLVGFFGVASNPAIAPSDQMIERAEIVQNSKPNRIVLEAADQILGPPDPTGSRSATASEAGLSIGQLVAIRPQG